MGNTSASCAYCISERLCLVEVQPLVSERVNDGSAVFIPDSVQSCQVELQSHIQSAALCMYIAAVKLTSSPVYPSPHIPVTLASLQDLIQLPAWRLKCRTQSWGSEDEAEGSHITVIM
jgi:hypothetical protein